MLSRVARRVFPASPPHRAGPWRPRPAPRHIHNWSFLGRAGLSASDPSKGPIRNLDSGVFLHEMAALEPCVWLSLAAGHMVAQRPIECAEDRVGGTEQGQEWIVPLTEFCPCLEVGLSGGIDRRRRYELRKGPRAGLVGGVWERGVVRSPLG